jgi:hypothetical protein
MKSIPLYLLTLVLVLGCAIPEQVPQDKNSRTGELEVPGVLTLGLEKDAIISRFPYGNAREMSKDIIEIDDVNFGIPGTWTLGFRASSLAWFSFTGYTSAINPLEFDATLERTEILLDHYSLVFGDPLRFTKGLQEFKDPSMYQHRGYQVLHALWETSEGNIIVDFSFIGEGDEYAFLVTIQGS